MLNTRLSLGGNYCLPKYLWCSVLLSAFALLTACAPQRPQMQAGLFLPETIDDPLEPMNRGIWVFNRKLLTGVVAPSSRGYKAVVPDSARKSIRNFGYNIIYPGRVVNQMFQGRWRDAGQDSLRFVSNSTVGILGLFDVASKWDIDKPDGDFAQTFHKWGWEADSFVMLPVLGPSDEVHAVGLGASAAVNPLGYNDTTRKIAYGVTYNRVAESAENHALKVSADPDPYSTLKYLWSYSSLEEDPDWTVDGPADMSTLETMNVMNIQLKDPGFVYDAKSGKVLIPSTKKKLPYDCWIQKENAPVVYIVPGLGSHRKTLQVLRIAEVLYNKGFSVVVISGVFNPEFVKNALSNDVPGFAHEDCKDLLVALKGIDQKLEKKYSDRLGQRALVGFSMGGYQTLTLAAHSNEQSVKDDSSLSFSRYVAISPPVDLQYSLKRLDAFQNAPSAWPKAERQERINNTIHKVVAIRNRPDSLEGPPFSTVESQYIMGLVFRFTLRNTIYASQARRDMGILNNRMSYWNREAAYQEIMGISFNDYFERFVLPYYESKGVASADILRFNDLSHCAGVLKESPNSMVITARNDFLLAPKHIDWLQETFGAKRLTLLPNGGHMGYLDDESVQEVLVGYLEDLKD